MKKFLLGVAVAVVALLLVKYFTDKKEDKERLEADTALIQTQIANVSKSTLWICFRLIRKSSQ